MRVVNMMRETITEYDLSKGRLINSKAKAEDGTIEAVQMYVPNRTIEYDGKPEPETEASADDVLNAMLGVV